MKKWIIIGLAEAGCLAVGLLLWALGLIPGWTVALALLAPPVVAVVAVVGFFILAQARGENPFQ